MKKITYYILSLFLIVLISGCAGYKPIFNSANIKFEIADYSIEGDKTLGNKIYSKLRSASKPKKNNQEIRKISVLIKVSKDKKATAKSTTGKILEYKIILTSEIRIKDFLTNDKILNQNFTSSSNYKVQDQYSDTMKLENKAIENLINKTHQELLIKLSQKI